MVDEIIKEAIEDGMSRATIAILEVLHDEFDFDDTQLLIFTAEVAKKLQECK